MARLPQPGGDAGNWGSILNDYLSQSHNPDGTVRAGAVSKNDVGLGNVNNTSDLTKPVSNAVQVKLDEKLSVVDLDTQVAALVTDTESETGAAVAASTPTTDSLIQRVRLNSDAPMITFDTIPAGYGELTLTGRVRGTRAANSVTVLYRYNSDASVSYRNIRHRGNGSTSESTSSAVIDSGWLTEATAANSPANTYAPFDARIVGYDQPEIKTLLSEYATPFGSSTSQIRGSIASTYQSTAAINSITIFPLDGTFLSGTDITLRIVPSTNSAAPTSKQAMIVMDGDSLTASATGGGTSLTTHLSPKVKNLLTWNKGTASQTIVQMLADVSTTVDTLYAPGELCIASCWGGTNDLTRDDDYNPISAPDGNEIYSDYVTWLNGRRALGFKVIAWTLTPRSGLNAAQQTALDTFNTLVRSNAGAIADSLFDVAAIAELADPMNVTYYTDGLHQTDVGRELISVHLAQHLASNYNLVAN